MGQTMRALTAVFAALVLSAPAGAAGQFDRMFDVVAIPGSAFVMGDPDGEANEAPRNVSVSAFSLMRTEVTNAQFARFVAETGYVTDAERSGAGQAWAGRWRLVDGANWRRPAGGGSDITGLDHHPVVQVSARDAEAFCGHHGMRLPTEAEWEYAARGDDQRRFPWGNVAPRQGFSKRLANFGTVACCAPDAGDGYRRTAPVGSYPDGASPFGLLDMAGNVWEWTASAYSGQPARRTIRGGGWGNNPYCLRVSYRHGNPSDFALDMVGFRCAGT